MPRTSRPLKLRSAASGLLLGWIALSIAFPAISAVATATPGSSAGPAAPAFPPVGVSAASATWNGVNVTQAGAQGSAFSVSTGTTVQVVFSFFGPGANVTARLQAYYFGAALSTDNVVTTVALTGHGTGILNWSFGDYTYVLQGLFRLTASLVFTGNGSTAWSASFWVNEKAPYRVESGFTIFLLALGVAELYGIASVGGRRRPPATPPTQWKGPETVTAAPAAGPTPAAPPEPPEDSSPPPMPDSPPAEDPT